jgi:hypothetical protein
LPTRETCPSCGHVLSIAAGVTEPWLTCPNCLGWVANTRALIREGPPPTPTAPGRSCARCGKELDLTWRFCPHCRAAVVDGDRRRPVPSLDRDVRRDTGLTGPGLLLLATLSGVGTGLLFCTGLWRAGGPRETNAVLGVAAFLFVTVVFAGLLLSSGGRDPRARGAGRLLLRGAVSSAIAAAVTVVVAGAIAAVMVLAALVAFLETCARGCR